MHEHGSDRLPVGTVTFLFTDIEASTRLLSETGRGYDELLERHDRILRGAIADHAGTVVNTEGDALFAAFTLARDAVEAAAAAQRGLAAEQWPGGRPIRVRMGIHTGEGRRGGADYVGMDVHVAARIASAGHGGQVLLSEATRALVLADLPPDIHLRDLGTHRLKDIAEPTTIHQLEIDGLATEFVAINTLDARPTNLSPQLTSFIGRERDLETLVGLLREARLVTLTGPGGSGKTRLAIELGGLTLPDRPDGAFFVDLARIDRPDLIASAIVDAIGLDIDPRADATEVLKARLRDREPLLLLDNFEHVIDGAAFVAELLAAAPHLRVLATSRMPLRVGGEREYAVGPIGLPALDASSADIETSAAGALFLDRARAVRSDLELGEDDLSVVAEIVTRLEGIPLAIELAASRARILDLATMRSQLDQQLPMLTGSQRDRPERQRTMRGAIDWSHRLLDDGERRLFARLAVFPGGCSVNGARAVCDDPEIGRSIIDGLESLVEKSLLRLQPDSDRGPRFGMLITIREYAAERLEQAGDADEVRRRAASYLMAVAEEAEPHLVAKDQVRWLDRAEQEQANVRAALRWAIDSGDAELAQRTASALWRLWQQRGPVSEGLSILDEVVALEGTEPAVRARAYAAAGALAWWSGDDVAARAHFERGYELAQQSGDERSLMVASKDLGFVTLWPLARLRRDVAETRPPTPPTGRPSPPEMDPADIEAAETLLQLSLGIAERLGDELGIAQAKRALGQLAGVARHDMPAAIPLVEEALERFERVGDRWEATETHITLANALRFSPHVERARDHYLTGIDSLMLARNPMAATVLLLFAGFESQVGRHEQAVRLFAAGEAERAANGAQMPPGGALLMGDPIGAAVEAIGRPAVDEALAEGATMSLEAAVAYARTV